MNLSHQAAFKLIIEEGVSWPSREQLQALEQHLAGCEICLLDSEIVDRLRQEAELCWPHSLKPTLGSEEMISGIKERFQSRRVFRRLFSPSPALVWASAAVLLVLLLSWVILNLIANPDAHPAGPASPTPKETQTPRETMQPAFTKTPVEPIFKAPFIRLGRPSPSGEYLYFLADDPKELGRAESSIQLHFYEAASGKVCTAGELYFNQADTRKGFAWLPDERLLVVDVEGEVLALPPCETEAAERLTGLFPEAVERLYAPTVEGEAVLFKGEEAYWLFEPTGERVRRIEAFRPGFIPGSDQFAWSPSGRRLAATVMNGASGQEGSRLYVLDLETLETFAILDLPGSENQSAPWVDWLSEDWLVLPDPEKALLVNLAGGEMKPVDVYRELFQLEFSQPFMFSSLDYQVDEANDIFHLATASIIDGTRHIHLYHSENGRVETLEQETDALLILPDREVLIATYWEDQPTYRDEYEMIWVDNDRPPHRLVVEGHTPRQYPQLFPRILPGERLAFSSSQGVSLYTYAEDVRRTGFWSLQEYQGSGVPEVTLVEASGGLLVAADLWESGQPGALRGLYFIPLP